MHTCAQGILTLPVTTKAIVRAVDVWHAAALAHYNQPAPAPKTVCRIWAGVACAHPRYEPGAEMTISMLDLLAPPVGYRPYPPGCRPCAACRW